MEELDECFVLTPFVQDPIKDLEVDPSLTDELVTGFVVDGAEEGERTALMVVAAALLDELVIYFEVDLEKEKITALVVAVEMALEDELVLDLLVAEDEKRTASVAVVTALEIVEGDVLSKQYLKYQPS